jgi:uncharacterized protein YjiS (DUF1127 family)
MTLFPIAATPPAIPARWTASRYRPSTSIVNAFTTGLKAVLNTLVMAQDNARRRYALANLDDRMLSDIGLTRGAADQATKWLIR